MTSPSMMLTIGTRPPSGVNESCMLLTAPQLASVVTVAKRAELAMPKRDFLAFHVAAGHMAPALIGAGQQRIAADLRPVRGRHTGQEQDTMAANTAQPARRPACGRACRSGRSGSTKIENISMKFENGVGFS